MPKTHNSTILRNTASLYARMLIGMAAGLYSSRIALDALGVDDFGTYHAVAGLVAVLGFAHGALSSATQRYYAFDIGRNNGANLSNLFGTNIKLIAISALIITLAAETAGLWFIREYLRTPPNREASAILAYHLSLAAFIISLFTIPLSTLFLAHERMGIYSIIGTGEIILKLLAATAILHYTGDRLLLYALLLLASSIATLTCYVGAKRRHLPHIRLAHKLETKSIKDISAFAAWSTWGNLAAALSGPGNNLLLNVYFGPSVNAGRTIALQGTGALNNVIGNLQSALNPQIIKLYASGKSDEMHLLVRATSKYNFLLLLSMSAPVILNAETILSLWLIQPPPFAAIFLQLGLINALIDSLSLPLMVAAQATGMIRLYQLITGGILILSTPISFLLLKSTHDPTVVALASIALSSIALASRIAILRTITRMPAVEYIKCVIPRAALATASAFILSAAVTKLGDQSISTIVVVALCFATSSCACYLTGLTHNERKWIVTTTKSIVLKHY